jgi:hypothetical protein
MPMQEGHHPGMSHVERANIEESVQKLLNEIDSLSLASQE